MKIHTYAVTPEYVDGIGKIIGFTTTSEHQCYPYAHINHQWRLIYSNKGTTTGTSTEPEITKCMLTEHPECKANNGSSEWVNTSYEKFKLHTQSDYPMPYLKLLPGENNTQYLHCYPCGTTACLSCIDFCLDCSVITYAQEHRSQIDLEDFEGEYSCELSSLSNLTQGEWEMMMNPKALKLGILAWDLEQQMSNLVGRSIVVD